MHPKTEGILESSLYVADVTSSVQFYERIFGFRVIGDFEGEVAQWRRVTAKYCCYSRRVARARHRRRTTATVSSIWRSRSLRRSVRVGKLGWRRTDRGGREADVGVGRPEPLF
ncbi:MAG: hypothetical protein DMG27_15895 [Acidobacteria bacterium]|nr:MAG: hypothetical protein DMG27_15895 [Acidobacteriota bacterium]